MGTKNNPGSFDCYQAAMPNEPMFILLARDPDAPMLVELWAKIREKHGCSHHTGSSHTDKVKEAREVAAAMVAYLDSDEYKEYLSEKNADRNFHHPEN